jgi:hypothetical protein
MCFTLRKIHKWGPPVLGPALPKSDQAGVGRRWTAGFSPLPRTLNRLQARRTYIKINI